MPTLSRNALIVLTALLAPAASADMLDEPEFKYVASYEFKRPKALEPDHDLSMKLSETLLQEQHFGGLPAMVVADASVADASVALDAWAFYIFDISATDAAKRPEQIVRDTFDQLRAGSGDVVSWDEKVEDNLATATMEWRHKQTETLTLVRSQMWVTSAGAPHQLRAECIMRAERADEIRAKCENAFAALTVVAPDRGALGPLPTASKPAMQPRPSDAGPNPSSSPSLRPPTAGAVLYNREPVTTPEKDNTVLYVGGAILLVVAVYMAMRRSPDDDDSDAEEPGDE